MALPFTTSNLSINDPEQVFFLLKWVSFQLKNNTDVYVIDWFNLTNRLMFLKKFSIGLKLEALDFLNYRYHCAKKVISSTFAIVSIKTLITSLKSMIYFLELLEYTFSWFCHRWRRMHGERQTQPTAIWSNSRG